MTARPQARRFAALAFAIVAGVHAGGAAAQWAWKDDGGRVVYSDRPPPPGVKASQILRQPAGSPVPARQTSPAPASADAAKPAETRAHGAPKTIAEQEMEIRKRQQERADNERKAQEEQQKAAARAADCERSRGYLRSLEDGVRVSRTNAAGAREFLDDSQRAAEVERIRKVVQQVCD